MSTISCNYDSAMLITYVVYIAIVVCIYTSKTGTVPSIHLIRHNTQKPRDIYLIY